MRPNPHPGRDVFDTDQRVALRVASACGPRSQANRHARGRCRIGCAVRPCSSIEQVRAGQAMQNIVAPQPGKQVLLTRANYGLSLVGHTVGVLNGHDYWRCDNGQAYARHGRLAPASNSLAQNNKTALPWVSLWLGRRAAGAATALSGPPNGRPHQCVTWRPSADNCNSALGDNSQRTTHHGQILSHIGPTTGAAFFSRNSDEARYSGVQLHINLNLLAAAVGDAPPPGVSLVPPVRYDTREPGVGVIDVQPLVQVRGSAQVELPIGPHLKNFLDHPLGNPHLMNLSLPFYNLTLGIGDSGGGWFRSDYEDDGAFHGGWDVMPKSQTGAADLFDVCAAADGVVIGITKRKNCPIVIRHHAGGTEFLTIYQHLDLRSCALNVNDAVNRGQFLAKITDEKGSARPRQTA